MSMTSCPGCGAPAEITERFTLASTDGPVAHVAVCCAGGHHYRMAADRLPVDLSRPPAPETACPADRLPRAPPAPQTACPATALRPVRPGRRTPSRS